MKSAFIAIVGRPSSGKSSFLNAVCRGKVSIVTPVPQTTRNKIRGIYTDNRAQFVFIDTPGFHLSEKKFNLHLTKLVEESFEEVDILLYMIDISRPPGEEESKIAQSVSNFKGNKVIVFNKIDIEKNYIAEHEITVRRFIGEVPIFKISALTGEGLPQLLEYLTDIAPEGELYYDPDIYTDQEPSFRISEIIREKVILETREEIPHSIYIEILDMEMREEQNLLWVRAIIYVERESQKGIIIGQGGNKIKSIRLAAERDLREIFPYRVKLDLRVKVKKKWKQNEQVLKKLIF